MVRARRGRRSSGAPWVRGAVVVLIIVVAAGAWYWLMIRDGGETPPRDLAAGDTMIQATTADAASDLPPPSASDGLVRDAAAALSANPGLAEWLVTDSLIRTFVGAVVQVAAGRSPREELSFMEPEGSFQVRESDTGVVVDPASYTRYDPIVATLVSLDTQGTAELYRRLRPLFQRAYGELGFRGSFDGTLARAVQILLAVPVPEGPVELEPAGAGGYTYRDPELEELDPAQKHLLRMGPDNVERVQAKLGQLAEALVVEDR